MYYINFTKITKIFFISNEYSKNWCFNLYVLYIERNYNHTYLQKIKW